MGRAVQGSGLSGHCSSGGSIEIDEVKFHTKVCWGKNRTNEQSNGVLENLWRKMVLRNRAI